MRLPILLASSLLIMTGPALAKECRIPEPKPGQALHVPPECKDVARSKPKTEALRSEPGAFDLGNGTTVRIGGRVRAEMGWRR